jgi:hypothetical protein
MGAARGGEQFYGCLGGIVFVTFWYVWCNCVADWSFLTLCARLQVRSSDIYADTLEFAPCGVFGRHFFLA